MSSHETPSLLIIGGTKAGKSHFGAQLLRRLETKVGQLRLVGAVGDLSPFREVLDRLSQGRAATHTPSGTYKECIWTVAAQNGSDQSELVWPDYAGEQIEGIVRERHVPEQWVDRIRRANGWLLFVRLNIINTPPDIFDRPRDLAHMQGDATPQHSARKGVVSGTTAASQAPSGSTERSNVAPAATTSGRTELSTQERLVELLQALLYAGQISSNVPVRTPALTVVLSCYDEVASPVDGVWEDPAAVLCRRLPLLSQFIESTWHADKLEVVGLSALGKPLSEEEGDDEFMDNGPETQGWCISKGDRRSQDLTYLVASIMERVNSS